MALSWIWILGIMAVFGIKFNIINIILSTLVFALGDDYSIFTMDGLQQQYAKRQKEQGPIRLSILLSASTTIIGLGALFLAQHPALRSMAFVSIIGILCVWLMSQTVQPFLFSLLITNPTARHHPPYTLWGMMKSAFAFAYFVLGAVLLTLTGLALRLIPIKKSSKKYAYHWLLSRFAGSLIHIMGNVRKRFINEPGEDFSKPAVVIANHQSFLDILLMVMLNPKLILLTSDWVWNSPIFGAVVRMADYYPASGGAETGLEVLKERVQEGYSIVVFPEGTRSEDDTIHRFHKGAFFLAEHLGLDIVPVLIHGTGATMAKGSFYLNDGRMTVKILPRIRQDDPAFGDAYAARTKLVGRYFRQQYETLRQELETPDYYRNRVISNYLYKGPVLEWYARIKIGLENNYRLFDSLLPRKGHILDVGCGYGFMTNMLALTSKERTLTGIDYDRDKILVAQNGFLGTKNVSFGYENALEASAGPAGRYQGIILSDVLHYLEPDEQSLLLQHCAGQLSVGGVLVIRDGFKEMGNRHKGTQLTEWFSTRFCKFNKTAHGGLSFLSKDLIYAFAQNNQLEVSVIDNTKLTSNLIFLCKKIA
jgi:1-acyl-sn-glycerol-3-phosphate acyltransferase